MSLDALRGAWTRLTVAAALLVVHFLTLKLFVAPDAASILASTDPAIAKRVASCAAYGTDGFSFAGNIAGWIDRTVMPGRLTFFFRVIGMNSIASYMLIKFVGFGAMSKYFFSGVASLGNNHWAAMVYCLGQVVLEWLVLLFLHKKGTFLKV